MSATVASHLIFIPQDPRRRRGFATAIPADLFFERYTHATSGSQYPHIRGVNRKVPRTDAHKGIIAPKINLPSMFTIIGGADDSASDHANGTIEYWISIQAIPTCLPNLFCTWIHDCTILAWTTQIEMYHSLANSLESVGDTLTQLIWPNDS